MPVSIDLVETNAQIENLVNIEIVKYLNSKAKNAAKNIKDELSVLIENALKQTTVYKETQAGELKAMLGFHKGRERKIMDGIISIIAKEVRVDFKPFKYNKGSVITGGFEIYMVDADFKAALANSLAITNNDGQELHWLKWLLLDGDIIFTGYRMLIKPTTEGRSKEALMIKTFRKASFWKMPIEFAGVKELNWITKAFKGNTSTVDAVLPNIYTKMEDIVYSNIARIL